MRPEPAIPLIGSQRGVDGSNRFGLSQTEQVFVDVYCDSEGDIEAAQVAAGYSSVAYARQILKKARIIDAISAHNRALVRTEGVELARETLFEIMRDKSNPANARIKAADTTLRWAREIGVDQVDDFTQSGKNLSEMTVGELGILIEKLESALSDDKTIDISTT